MGSRVALTRKVAFSSGHRYWRSSLSEEENRQLFGPWASPYNHGHNYVLWVTAEGEVDESNGMVVNIKWIDDVIKEKVIRPFDQKSINDEVPGFLDVAPSVENLLFNLRDRLVSLPGSVTLTHLKLEETPLLYGEWEKDSPMIKLTRVYEFAASHRLHVPALPHEENVRLFGKCNNENGHGHNYVLEVTVIGEPNEETGMLVNIDELDRVVNHLVVDRYDHHNLDLDVPELLGKNTTSEIVAQEIFNHLDGKLPAKLSRIRLFETARNVFEVTG
ncbi:MAG: 6-carboxytetrahydropterin synthase [Fimbriimonadaceae bacterium]|jgi:6-pyruvoyltetrahydropterin/6-carboxytetrahydropterin synthase|nr:6-carboxytetrahydropterin synthase [Fimbriimonadaceae bacterium]